MTKSDTFFRGLLRLGAFFVLQALMMAITYEFTDNTAIIYTITYLFPTIFLIYKWRRPLKDEFSSFKESFKKDFLKVFLVYLLFTLMCYTTNNMLYQLIGDIASNETAIRNELNSSPLIIAIIFIFLAPISEELIFRFNFRNTLKTPKRRYIITSILFALMHIAVSTELIFLLYLIPYLFLSLGLGYSYYKSDNIFMSIIIHIFHNFINIMLLFIM